MKKFLLLFLLLPFICTAQDVVFPTNESGEISFSDVVEVPNVTKDDMFSNAKVWIAKTYGDYKSVLQFEDTESGKIIIKGISNVEYKHIMSIGITEEFINYTLTLEFKDGKYRYTIDNLTFGGTQSIPALNFKGRMNPFYPKDHLTRIAKYENELNELKAADTSKLKKKKLAEHEEAIADKENNIKGEKMFYISEYETIINLSNIMKSAIAKNNDF